MLETYFLLLFVMVSFHFLMDYPLQSDFIAKFKARIVDGKYNPFWYHCLTAHSFIHALPVLLLTSNIVYGVIMVVSHWIIDYAKCENKISLNVDQLLHLCVILLIATSHIFM